jgi:ABC-type transporter Mla MlaB component
VEIAVHAQEVTPDAAQSPHGLARLRFAGPLTAVTAPALRSQVRTAVRDRQTRMLIDLYAVTALDAAGIAGLLEAPRVLEARPSGTLVLRANGLVCRALEDRGRIAAFALWTGRGM